MFGPLVFWLFVLIVGSIGGFWVFWTYLATRLWKRDFVLNLVTKSQPSPLDRAVRMKTLSPNSVSKEELRSYWKGRVLEHTPLKRLADNLWVVDGTLPPNGPQLPRRMVIHRETLNGENLLTLFSVICLREDILEELESLGKVERIIIPNAAHTLDVNFYRLRYPNAKLLYPYGQKKVIQKKVPSINECVENYFKKSVIEELNSITDAPVQILIPSVSSMIRPFLEFFFPFQGSYAQTTEYAYLFSVEEDGKPSGTALVVCDLFFNIPDSNSNAVSRFLGTSGFFGVTAMGVIIQVENHALFLKWLKDLLQIVTRAHAKYILVAHGDLISGEDSVQSSIVKAIKKFESEMRT
jgi:hypothetical protein